MLFRSDRGLVARISHWEWDDPRADSIRDILCPHIIPSIGPFVSLRSHILDSRLPWDVHNDYVINCRPSDLEPYVVVMIPLETAPTRTIFFEQSSEYKEFGRYKQEHEPIPNHVPADEWADMLTHCRWRDRFWLSIDHVYEWKQGDLVIFDRRQWHSSDNFVQSNLNNKRAIILFTNRPE